MKNHCYFSVYYEKELDAKGIPTWYSSLKNILSATDCTDKKLAMCHGKYWWEK